MEIPNTSVTSFLLTAPTSTLSVSILSDWEARSASFIKWIGLEEIIPRTSFPLLVRIITVCAGRFVRITPPSMRISRLPFSLMLCTINPHSSVWASSITTGFSGSSPGIRA